MIISISHQSIGRLQDSEAAITDHVTAHNGKYNNPDYAKVATKYVLQVPLSSYHSWHHSEQLNQIIVKRENDLYLLFSSSAY